MKTRKRKPLYNAAVGILWKDITYKHEFPIEDMKNFSEKDLILVYDFGIIKNIDKKCITLCNSINNRGKADASIIPRANIIKIYSFIAERGKKSKIWSKIAE